MEATNCVSTRITGTLVMVYHVAFPIFCKALLHSICLHMCIHLGCMALKLLGTFLDSTQVRLRITVLKMHLTPHTSSVSYSLNARTQPSFDQTDDGVDAETSFSFSLSSCLPLFSAFFLALTIGSINIFWIISLDSYFGLYSRSRSREQIFKFYFYHMDEVGFVLFTSKS